MYGTSGDTAGLRAPIGFAAGAIAVVLAAAIALALAFEGKRLHRVDYDAREPRGVEHAFIEIKYPAAVL